MIDEEEILQEEERQQEESLSQTATPDQDILLPQAPEEEIFSIKELPDSFEKI
ncbi:hypothetical protein IJU97_01805 [bacterium]|nr:hypothetical protein [bacterium]